MHAAGARWRRRARSRPTRPSCGAQPRAAAPLLFTARPRAVVPVLTNFEAILPCSGREHLFRGKVVEVVGHLLVKVDFEVKIPREQRFGGHSTRTHTVTIRADKLEWAFSPSSTTSTSGPTHDEAEAASVQVSETPRLSMRGAPDRWRWCSGGRRWLA